MYVVIDVYNGNSVYKERDEEQKKLENHCKSMRICTYMWCVCVACSTTLLFICLLCTHAHQMQGRRTLTGEGYIGILRSYACINVVL